MPQSPLDSETNVIALANIPNESAPSSLSANTSAGSVQDGDEDGSHENGSSPNETADQEGLSESVQTSTSNETISNGFGAQFWLSTNKWVTFLLGLAMFALTVFAIWISLKSKDDGHLSEKYAAWTAKKDFIEFCADEAKRATTPDCALAFNMTLPAPPNFVNHIKRAVIKQARKAEGQLLAKINHSPVFQLGNWLDARSWTTLLFAIAASTSLPIYSILRWKRSQTKGKDSRSVLTFAPDTHVHQIVPRQEICTGNGPPLWKRKLQVEMKTFDLILRRPDHPFKPLEAADECEDWTMSRRCTLTIEQSHCYSAVFKIPNAAIEEERIESVRPIECETDWLGSFHVSFLLDRSQSFQSLYFTAQSEDTARKAVEYIRRMMDSDTSSTVLIKYQPGQLVKIQNESLSHNQKGHDSAHSEVSDATDELVGVDQLSVWSGESSNIAEEHNDRRVSISSISIWSGESSNVVRRHALTDPGASVPNIGIWSREYSKRFADSLPELSIQSGESNPFNPLAEGEHRADRRASLRSAEKSVGSLTDRSKLPSELEQSPEYAKHYSVKQKPLLPFMPSRSRTLLLDRKRFLIYPPAKSKTQMVLQTIPYSNVIGSKVFRRRPTQFQVAVYEERQSKRYDFEAANVSEASEIVEAIQKGMRGSEESDWRS
ncbi:MAG: hypothetical protein M1820_009460 [Bogoriella megaspora]|nr:MAG: hypothetical protein M1820_009460 [Bogoriella megaspora]